MHKTRSEPTLIDPTLPEGKHPKIAEYKKISDLLDKHPEWSKKVAVCLQRDAASQSKRGRGDALTGEQVLRIAIVKFREGLDYRDLAHSVEDSAILRWFCRTGGLRKPLAHTTLQQGIAAIGPIVLEEINTAVIQETIDRNVESGKTVRVDTTVVETNIVHPCDSRLIAKGIQKLTHLMRDARNAFDPLRSGVPYHNRIRAAKKASFRITMAKGKYAHRTRKKEYKKLFRLLSEVLGLASGFISALKELEQTLSDCMQKTEAAELAQEIEHFLGLARQVQNQAERRILQGEKVPAKEKILSLFETHTDLICRGKTLSPAEFGHKVFFSSGKSGLILDYQVCEGNPGDDSLWPEALERHEKRFGKPPKEMTGDRRFYSAHNLLVAEEAGVDHVAIPKPGKPTRESVARTKQPWWKRLMRFRSGIEGILSWLLRSFGLHRCLWKGKEHFSAYVGWAVLACNLTQFARKA